MPDSDTPETERALHGVWYRGDHGSAIPALCRRLERERDRLREEIETFQNKTQMKTNLILEAIREGCAGNAIVALNWSAICSLLGPLEAACRQQSAEDVADIAAEIARMARLGARMTVGASDPLNPKDAVKPILEALRAARDANSVFSPKTPNEP